jgi:transcriptional regulator with XRE-family HTH domain
VIAKSTVPPMWHPEPSAKEIGARLQGLRRGKRMSLAEVSSKSGINYNVLYAYEHGRRVPCTKNLVRLAMVLEPGVDWLLFGRPRRQWDKLRKVPGGRRNESKNRVQRRSARSNECDSSL